MSADYDRARLKDPKFIEQVLEARRTPIGVKILAGPRLFDQECALERLRIREQFPEFTDEQVKEELGRRLAARRQIDEAGIYRNVGMLDE